VLVFFSCLVSGSKDLAVYFVVYLVSMIAGGLGQIRSDTVPEGLGRVAAKLLTPALSAVGDILDFVLKPQIDLSPLVHELSVPWTSFTAYACVVAVFLSLCIFSLNRRELPYGAD
jgi:hypothetical protein